MNFIIVNNWLFIPLLVLCVFIFAYLQSDNIIYFLHKKSLGSRTEIIELLDKMFIDTNKRSITLALLLSSFGLGAIVFLLLWPNLIAGGLFGSAVTVAMWSLPKMFVRQLWEKRCDKLVAQMVDGMTIMSNGVSSGLSVAQSMERVVENIKGPLSQEFTLVLNKVRLGQSLDEALAELSERVPRQDVQMFVTSVAILKETGGNMSETFATITTTIRERQKVEQKIEAMTAQGLTQGVIITLVPFVLAGVLLVINPEFIKPMFTTPLGWFAIFCVFTLQIIGGHLIKKIVTIKV